MEIRYTQENGVAVFHIEGRLTYLDAPRFKEVLQRFAGVSTACEVDLGGLSFVDSTGLSLFVGLYDAACASGVDLAFRHAQGPVKAALKNASFETLVPMR
ncbi:STAS domain protein [mine drainage metagenome]|uniref:STAS domain protein n=1 Tax=mine drainage metagenome TaxID=410659 RepID=A0A1J5RBP9_9ZZZZ